MDADAVMAWVARYERAWRAADASAVAGLFTEQAEYLVSPYDPVRTGHAAIEEFWTVDEGVPFEVEARPVAVQGRTAVVRLVVNYLGEAPQEYSDLWVLEFAADGRVARFEEWPFWPGKPHTTDQPAT
jgi:uncharacterized protein (TIGR02246 family)